MVKRFIKAGGIPLGGLGVQCHFYTEEQPDPHLIKVKTGKGILFMYAFAYKVGNCQYKVIYVIFVNG